MVWHNYLFLCIILLNSHNDSILSHGNKLGPNFWLCTLRGCHLGVPPLHFLCSPLVLGMARASRAILVKNPWTGFWDHMCSVLCFSLSSFFLSLFLTFKAHQMPPKNCRTYAYTCSHLQGPQLISASRKAVFEIDFWGQQNICVYICTHIYIDVYIYIYIYMYTYTLTYSYNCTGLECQNALKIRILSDLIYLCR